MIETLCRHIRDEGLLEFRRGRGTTVTGTPQRSAVLRQVPEPMDFARLRGYHREDVIGMIENRS